jgi:outer membrane protein assembly factor BamD (BamD/ComL family)
VYFEAGRYSEAIQEYRHVADHFPDDKLAAQAQYQAAYTEIYFKNSGSDYGMAAKDFQKLIQKYPNSPWKDPAENWLNVLTQLESLKTEKEKLKSDLQRLLDLDMQSEKKRRELK